MGGMALSKEALSAYLYELGALEVAKQQAIEKQKKPRMVLSNNESVMKNLKTPEPPVYKELDSKKDKIITIIIAGAVAGGIVFLVCLFLSLFVNFSKVIPVTIATIIGLLFGCYCNKVSNSVIKDRNKKLEKDYQQELEYYNQTKATFEQAESTFHIDLRRDLEKFENLEKDIESELRRQYALGILHPQYQNVEAILVMHNLLITGRCDTLKEALNAYEDFVWRQKDAQWKDAVLKQLAEICDNQRELIFSVDTLSTQTANIATLTERGFNGLEMSVEDIRVQNEIIAGNTRTMALLQSLDFWQTHVVEK